MRKRPQLFGAAAAFCIYRVIIRFLPGLFFRHRHRLRSRDYRTYNAVGTPGRAATHTTATVLVLGILFGSQDFLEFLVILLLHFEAFLLHILGQLLAFGGTLVGEALDGGLLRRCQVQAAKSALRERATRHVGTVAGLESAAVARGMLAVATALRAVLAIAGSGGTGLILLWTNRRNLTLVTILTSAITGEGGTNEIYPCITGDRGAGRADRITRLRAWDGSSRSRLGCGRNGREGESENG